MVIFKFLVALFNPSNWTFKRTKREGEVYWMVEWKDNNVN